jgi:hypothetical protein
MQFVSPESSHQSRGWEGLSSFSVASWPGVPGVCATRPAKLGRFMPWLGGRLDIDVPIHELRALCRLSRVKTECACDAAERVAVLALALDGAYEYPAGFDVDVRYWLGFQFPGCRWFWY